MNISFDKSLKGRFMAAQKLSSDEGGYLVDLNNKGKRVVDDDQLPIKTKNFAGFRNGSKVYLARTIETVIREAKLDNSTKKKPSSKR